MISVAAWLLTACGTALVGIGGFFVVARPPLLPEDARYLRTTRDQISGAVPRSDLWLRHVFWVMGGYIATTGLMVVYVASTGLRSGSVGVLAVLAIAGVTSIGWMSVVNFMIRSDFRWALVCLDLVWALGLSLGLAAR